jgi:hypothetical protein
MHTSIVFTQLDPAIVTMLAVVESHVGRASRVAFQGLPKPEQDALFEFLKTLQVLPPGTRTRVVDEQKPREWPPKVDTSSGVHQARR